jgi:hypothetical protein
MNTAAPHRRSRIVRLALAGTATLAVVALGSGSAHLSDVALPAGASGPVTGFATDDSDDEAQLQEQQALQQMQQAEQQAEQQNEQAQQQAEQSMQQAQMDEQQANNP